MVVEFGLVLAVLATLSGIVITIRTPFAVKAVLAAVLGTITGLFIAFAMRYLQIQPEGFVSVVGMIGVISFLGSLLGMGLVGLKRLFDGESSEDDE